MTQHGDAGEAWKPRNGARLARSQQAGDYAPLAFLQPDLGRQLPVSNDRNAIARVPGEHLKIGFEIE